MTPPAYRSTHADQIATAICKFLPGQQL